MHLKITIHKSIFETLNSKIPAFMRDGKLPWIRTCLNGIMKKKQNFGRIEKIFGF
jgi:hypothetical protein